MVSLHFYQEGQVQNVNSNPGALKKSNSYHIGTRQLQYITDFKHVINVELYLIQPNV